MFAATKEQLEEERAMQEKTIQILKDNNEKNEKNVKKAYLRPKDGPIQYGISRPKFIEIAKRAGAYYKIDSVVLIKKETFDHFLDGCNLD